MAAHSVFSPGECLTHGSLVGLDCSFNLSRKPDFRKSGSEISRLTKGENLHDKEPCRSLPPQRRCPGLKNKPLFSLAIRSPSPSLLPTKRLPLYRDSESPAPCCVGCQRIQKTEQNTPPSVSFPYLFTFPKFPTLGGLKFFFSSCFHKTDVCKDAKCARVPTLALRHSLLGKQRERGRNCEFCFSLANQSLGSVRCKPPPPHNYRMGEGERFPLHL